MNVYIWQWSGSDDEDFVGHQTNIIWVTVVCDKWNADITGCFTLDGNTRIDAIMNNCIVFLLKPYIPENITNINKSYKIYYTSLLK